MKTCPSDVVYGQRLLSRIRMEGECWIYTGTIGTFGYGQIFYRGEKWMPHRLMHHIFKGPIPAGFDVCHSCDTPSCVNPAHLWAAPRSVNMRDCVEKMRHASARKTHCIHGHEFTPENTRVRSNGKRVCIQCQRERWGREKGKPKSQFPKTHCKHGHPLSGDNVYVPPGDPTRRKCKACHYMHRNRRMGRAA